MIKSFLLTLTAILQINPIVAEEPAKPKVVVIGAGLAGLTSAYRLQQKGFDVEVYEARNRVGGRLFTVNLNGTPAELGGQNITDGGFPKSTLALLDELGLQASGGEFIFDRVHLQTEEGGVKKTYDIAALLKEKNFDSEDLKERLVELAEASSNMREILDQLFEKTDPVYAALAVRLQAWEGGAPERLSTACIGTLYQQMLGGISVTHPGNQEEEPKVDVRTIQGGNAELPKRLAESLGEKVHLNAPLTAVSKTAAGSYRLAFANGQEADADLLVFAMPCSVYNDIAFEKNVIPEERLEAIKKVEYGTVTRMVFPACSSGEKSRPIFTDSMLLLRSPTLPYFTAYCVGESSRFDETSVAQTFAAVHKIAGGSSPLNPVLAKDELFASYEGPVAHSWPNDPYVKGSYSYIAAGQEEILTAMEEIGGVPVRSLFAPIDERLFFAGEHTTVLLDGIGTIEAACESGERAALLIEQTFFKAKKELFSKTDCDDGSGI